MKREGRMNRILRIGLPVLVCAMAAHANSITYQTPTGSTTGGGAVNASAAFTTGAGTVSITLTDLQANPTDVAQLVSDLDFTLSNGATVGTLTSSSGQLVTISNHTATLGATVATGWGVNNNVSGGIQLDALGFIGPANLIIGPGPYTNANGSINDNSGHNPFLNGSATFLLSVAGVTADTNITSATFSFGTTEGAELVTGCAVGAARCTSTTVPEPISLALTGSGLLGLFFLRRRSAR